MTEVVFRVMIALYTVIPPTALLVLIGLWLFAVTRLSGAVRRALLLTGIGAFFLAAVLFGGHWLLLQYELAWRFWFRMLLAVILWCTGLVVGTLTAYFISRTVKKVGLRSVLTVVAAFCLVIVMGAGTIWGGFWIEPSTETIKVYHGKKVVEEKYTWMDLTYTYYEYKGTFVRGDRPVGPIGG